MILIGNGFDKAHGLATSYPEFMYWYWDKWTEKLLQSDNMYEKDSLCSFKLKDYYSNSVERQLYGSPMRKFKDVQFRDCRELVKYDCEFNQCGFLKNINYAVEFKEWVDIEEEYYRILKSILVGKDTIDIDYRNHPEKLNAELSELTKRLIEYLNEIQNKRKCAVCNEMVKVLYGPVLSNDISVFRYEAFENHILNNLTLDRSAIAKLNKRYYGNDVEEQMRNLEEFKRNDYDETTRYNKIINNRFLLESLSFPNKILVLNFNYTNTESLYVKDKEGVDVVHIHGDLAHPENIIFGYGDELDDDYKDMQKTNNNEYLKNIKSIRYLESERYREVLKFIESSPYQIYVLGHSCGTSDRTLLNTLFEHRNCISIKPYFYQKDGNDNYLDIIENISRNFTDMKLMRDLVVNKTFCSPLPQANKY